MQGHCWKDQRRQPDLRCDTGARCAVRDGIDVLILRCGSCGREVSVTDEELRKLRTIDCCMCTKARDERSDSATRMTASRALELTPRVRRAQ